MRFLLTMVFLLSAGAGTLPAAAQTQDEAPRLDDITEVTLAAGDTDELVDIFLKLGEAVNREKALELNKPPADYPATQDPQASYDTGLAYLAGEVVPRDLDLAIAYLTRAADMDFGPAEYELGRLYLYEPGLENAALGSRLLREAAAHGSAEAAYDVGLAFAQNQTTQTDIEEARIYLQVAAERGITDAYYLLGELGEFDYRNGGPIEVALHWYELAEAAGIGEAAVRRLEMQSLRPPSPSAQAEFRMKRNDYAGAYPLLVEACALGEAFGCYHQASALADGRGVTQDQFAALSMFETLCADTEEYGCFEFARTVMMLGGAAGTERNQKAQNIFGTECGTNYEAADECYNVALMSWDDRYGLRSEYVARDYSSRSCQMRNTDNEACQMQRHFQIEDSWADVGTGTASTEPDEPDFFEGLLYGLAVGAQQQSGSSGNAATQYGETARQREADRVQYSIESMRPGSQQYGACPTVNSPGC